MKVFISWSGEKSHQIAKILRDWLPTVIHHLDPWVSSEDINKGDRWGFELSKQLDETHFGIICIDSSNVNSPWLNFEAGALSKSLERGKIFPILFGMSPTDLKGPIAQFQITSFEKDDFLKLVKSINITLGSSKIDTERLLRSFEIAWSGLLNAINKIQLSPSQILRQVDDKVIKDANIESTTPDSLKSIKFRIFYADTQSENVVSVKKIIEQGGGNVELERLPNPDSTQLSWNGVIFYRLPSFLESAVETKRILSKHGFVTIRQGGWTDDKMDITLWLSK